MNDTMQRLLEQRWPRVRDEAVLQLAQLRAAVADDRAGLVGPTTPARNIAHQLRGRFGMYGRPEASAVAGQIEDRLLATDQPNDTAALDALTAELSVLIDALDALLDQGSLVSSSE